jgi:transposase
MCSNYYSKMRQNLQATSNENRARIIAAYENGQTSSEIAAVLGMKRTTVDGIIRVYKVHNRVERLARGGPRPQKLTLEHKTAVRDWIDEDCSLTLSSIKERCRTDFGITVSERTIGRCIADFAYSLKRVHPIPVRRNDDVAMWPSDIFRRLHADSFAHRKTKYHLC